MNHAMLLRKYIDHVRQSEGIDFLDRLNEPHGSDIVFSDEEAQELRIIAGLEMPPIPDSIYELGKRKS